MQHIGIQLENLNGNVLETSEINFADVMKKVYETEDFKVEFPWLSTIDPYGDTIFNQLQIPQLINELNKLYANNIATEIIDFLNKINSNQDQLIRFIGD